MGYRAGLWGYFYLALAAVSYICMAWGFALLFGGAQDCKYTCPLLTQDSDFLNTILSNKTCDADSSAHCCRDASGNLEDCKYVTDVEVVTTLSFAYCTSEMGICLRSTDTGTSDDTITYGNECKDKNEILEMDFSTAVAQRCLYCDASGVVYWPSLLVASTEKWIPSSTCGSSYANAGLESADAPDHNYTYGVLNDIALDNTLMGADWFSENSPDLTGYPYCETPESMGWDTSAIDLQAPLTVTMLLLLCVFYTIMAVLSSCVGYTFYHFRGKYESDWGRLKAFENCLACISKKMQPTLRVINTISIFPIVYFFYLITVLGVCEKAANEYGQKTFFPMALYYSYFTVFALALNCIGGTLFRRRYPVETAFYNPLKTHKMSEKKTIVERLCKCQRSCWQFYSKWGGP